jgi:hypothetical protein
VVRVSYTAECVEISEILLQDLVTVKELKRQGAKLEDP